MKKRIVLGAAAVVVIAGIFCAAAFFPKGKTVRILSGGELVEEIDLSTSPNRVFTVECADGSNTIVVEDGKIRVSEADCPDKICVRTGWLGNVPIVCLPHKLVIEYSGGGDSADFAAR